MHFKNLLGSVLGLGRQVVESVVGLSDSTEEHGDHACNTKGRVDDEVILFCGFSSLLFFAAYVTCEATGLCKQECAPRHEKEQSRLQQLEIPQLSELGHVEMTVKEPNSFITSDTTQY